MWQRLERKISFLNCLFDYFVIFFIAIHISLFFLLTFFVIRIFFPSAFFYPHFPSASAIRRYPVRVLQTPVLSYQTVQLRLKSGQLIANQIWQFCYSYDYRPNWTPLSPVTITNSTNHGMNWWYRNLFFTFLRARFSEKLQRKWTSKTANVNCKCFLTNE